MARRPRGAPRRAPDVLTAAALRLERARAAGATAFLASVALSTAGVAIFLPFAIGNRRPHEDEVLALFVGRGSLGGALTEVHDRGGAPLHFLLAWAVVHAGGGLTALRILSAVCAVLAIPVVAALATRLAGRGVAAAATPLVAASWMLLFHGTFARMYALFLLTSALSFLALLRALERRSTGAWALWVVAAVATAASHTYGLIVIGSQAVFVVATRALPLRRAVLPFAAVAVLGVPLWLNDAVLASRYGIGVGSGGARFAGPWSVVRYFWHAAGDFTSGRPWIEAPLLVVAAVGLAALAREARLLVAAVVLTPAVVLAAARVGSSARPETRHLIFALPFLALALAAGLVRLLRRPALVGAAVVAVLAVQLAWGIHKTGELYRGEAPARVAARVAATRWLAATGRRDDVLLGYDPLFLDSPSRTVVPRADPKLALAALRAARAPLGRGVFVFDASDTGNEVQRLQIPVRRPTGFEARAFGPFLVLRTLAPTRTARGFLDRAVAAEAVGRALGLADADVNYDTMRLARHSLG